MGVGSGEEHAAQQMPSKHRLVPSHEVWASPLHDSEGPVLAQGLEKDISSHMSSEQIKYGGRPQQKVSPHLLQEGARLPNGCCS